MRSSELRMTPAALAAAAEGDLRNALVAATPGGIEASEKAGQQALVASTDMPKQLDRAAFEKVGFTFGADVDELFIKATLPPGWKRGATDLATAGPNGWRKRLDLTGADVSSRG